jgi:hypothetical protein
MRLRRRRIAEVLDGREDVIREWSRQARLGRVTDGTAELA